MNLEIIKEELRKMEDAEAKMLTIAAYGTGNSAEDKLIVEKLFEVAQYIVEIKDIIRKMENEQGGKMSRIEKIEEDLEFQAIEEINQMIDPQSWALCASLNSLGWDFKHNGLVIATGETQLVALKNTLVLLRENKSESYEIVDHPKHYGGKEAKHEAISVIEEWGLGFHLGNVVKYISRAGKKPDQTTISDLKKAAWYLDRYINNLEDSHVVHSKKRNGNN